MPCPDLNLAEWRTLPQTSANKMTPEYREQNSWWVRGELTEKLAFAHNSSVEMTLPDGRRKEGWIVGASMERPEVIFRVEACDGSGDFECVASRLRAIEIEEPNQTPESTAPSDHRSP